MPPQFLYFDMGNVLLRFSHERMAAQMAAVAGVAPQLAWKVLFEEGLQDEFERGDVTSEEFYSRFCERAGSRPDRDALDQAANDIFELNVPMVALVGHLQHAGYRTGVLSNASEAHWRHCTNRFALLTWLFPVHAPSFRLRATKPQPEIFAAAAGLAGVEPGGIFFTDDRPEHVAGAQAAGWEAVVFQSAAQINQELRRRGVVCNY
jgi:FMN phosphatase YigB (HAD superfamily)